MASYHIPSKAVRDLGFRSKLEVIVNQQLVDSGVPYAYEGTLNRIRYRKPVSTHIYLADFLLGNGIIIETKGRWEYADRLKHLLINDQHPILDIRLLFSNAYNKIRKGSKTTYGAWCDKYDIKWAHKVIPQSWLSERKSERDLNKIINLLQEMNPCR